MLFSETPFCLVPSFPASVTNATIQPNVEAPHLDRTPNPFLPPHSPPVHRQVLWIQLQSILALLAPAPDHSNNLSSCSHPAYSPALPHASRGNLKTCHMMSLPSKPAAHKGLASPPPDPPHATSLHSGPTGLLPVPLLHSSANVPAVGFLLCMSPSLRGHPLLPTSGSHPSLSLDDYNPLPGNKHESVPMQMRHRLAWMPLQCLEHSLAHSRCLIMFAE